MSRPLVESIAAVALVLVAACAPGREPGQGQGVTVVSVVDGDTVTLRVGEAEETARLLGIDTPESVKPDSPVECFGPEAAASLKRLLPAGSRVRLERDVEPRDRYGRLLVHLYRGSDGRHVNLAQVELGFAEPLTIEPNRAHAAELAAAAERARTTGKGLWSACPPSSGDQP